jgi:ribosome-associated toxin RatA of RatAB toxin-antitoxin module
VAESTTSSIIIRATPKQVMDVIADVGVYPEWTPGVSEVEVLRLFDDEHERVAEARFVMDQAGIKDEHVYVYEWEPDHDEVRWHLREPGKMVRALNGVYATDPIDSSTTEVSYSLHVDVSIPMLGMIRRKAEKVITDTALKGLKKRVEGSA